MRKPKVAIIHDWLTGMRGGEKCLEVFCELFPEATIFTLIHKKGSISKTIEEMEIRTSFLQKIPNIHKYYRWFLPLFPAAIERFDLTGFDIIISSSHCAAKGVRNPSDALHICYCYTPMRYAWKFFDEYFSKENLIKRYIIKQVMKKLRRWDLASNKRIDYFIAISDNIKRRIKGCYNIDSDIIYPPVSITDIILRKQDEGFYLVVSALVPYKKVELAVKAFTENGKKLVVIGSGSEISSLKKISGRNIEFLDWVDDDRLQEYYQKCRALVFPGEEDFGIVPLEAQSFGKPVIAYAEGGVLETVVPFDAKNESRATGVFFNEQTPLSLNKAIGFFERNIDKFDPEKARENVLRFSRERFKTEFKEYIERKWEKYIKKKDKETGL